jgi:hypothetical protein
MDQMKTETQSGAVGVSERFDDTTLWERFYGNGRVFIARGSRLLALKKANFEIDRLKDKDGSRGDYWITSEVIVGLGYDVSKPEAVRSLRKVIEVLEADESSKADP